MDTSFKVHIFEPCNVCGATVDLTDPRQIAHHKTARHATVVPAGPGKDRGGLLGGEHDEEIADFATCGACGQTYDTRAPTHALHHMGLGHKPLLPDA
jgi:hypothetical protein